MSQIPQYQSNPGRGQGGGTPGMAIASLVLGIISLALFCVWKVAIPAAILAIVLGFMAKSQLAPGQSGGGLATGGIVCGFIALLLAVVVIAGLLSLLHFGAPMLQQMQQQMQQQLQKQQQQIPSTTTSPAAMLHVSRLILNGLWKG